MRVPVLVKVAVVGLALLVPAVACSNTSDSLTGGSLPFPCADQTGYQLHVHPYLRIVVDGQEVPIPTNIGIQANCFEPIVTRDTSGILHIETNVVRDYTLGDFFRIWQASSFPRAIVNGQSFPVSYSATELMGHKVDAGHVVRLTVDGQPSSDGPGLILNRVDYCREGRDQAECANAANMNPAPAEVMTRYGTGHTVLLEYAGK